MPVQTDQNLKIFLFKKKYIFEYFNLSMPKINLKNKKYIYFNIFIKKLPKISIIIDELKEI